jgi:hypothetical protein
LSNLSKFVGETEIELGEEKLIERSPTGSLETPYENIEGLSETKTYLMIALNRKMYHVIPRGKVPQSEYLPFINALKEKVPRKI